MNTNFQKDYKTLTNVNVVTFLGEVERLLRDYPQNQELVRNLGSRYYQVVYPTQVRQREKFGVSTREIEKGYSNKVKLGHSLMTSRKLSTQFFNYIQIFHNHFIEIIRFSLV